MDVHPQATGQSSEESRQHRQSAVKQNAAVFRIKAAMTEATTTPRILLDLDHTLQEYQELLAQAVEAANAGTWYLEVNTQEFVASDRALALHGLPPGTRIDHAAALDFIHPDDRSSVKAGIQRTIEKGRPYRAEFRTIPINGAVRWLTSQARLMSGPKGPRVVGLIQDSTERKQAEEALRESEQRANRRLAEIEAIMEATPALIWITRDPECREMTGSRFTYEFLDMPLGSNLSKTGPACERPDHYQSLNRGVAIRPEALPMQRAAQGEEIRNYELELRFHDGTSHCFLGNATPLRTEKGEPCGAVGVFLDITERKQMEEEVQRARSELEILVAERTAELRNALARLLDQEKALRESALHLRQLSSQLLQAQENERKRVANEIHDNAGQVLTAVKYRVEGALLKMRKAAPDLNLEPIEQLVPLIQHCVEDMRRLQMELRPSMLDEMGLLSTIRWFCRQFHLTYPSMRLEQDLTAEENDIPEGLKIVIFRILQEALNNAGKYSDASMVGILLEENDGTIRLHISDNGRGFKVQAAQAIKAFGHGLGLSSMRERAQYSGGRLSIESAPGNGTCIEAVWPNRALM